MKKIIVNLFTKSILIIACFLTAIALTSCPNTITEKMYLQVEDAVAPKITVTSPIDGDAYGAYTLIAGTVSDLSDSGKEGKITNLSVEIIGLTGNQTIPVDKNGNFSKILQTSGAGYSGDIVLKVTAMDWNKNTREYS